MVESRPLPFGARTLTVLALMVLGVVAAWQLRLAPGGLVPQAGGWELTREFLGAALQPALDYEGSSSPHWDPFLLKVGKSLLRTLAFALAAMSLALLVGLPLGFLASDSWWRPEAFGGGRLAPVARPLQVLVRIWIALMRSVHELLWAVLFLAAMGLNTMAAVVAIAIPYAGTLAKVFSEMLDEAPRTTTEALRGIGASPFAAFLFGLFPRALPDLSAYAFYRFECAVRSSAVLGFFGYTTIGYHLELSFSDANFREVWTYLYALLCCVLLLEAWSTALRRRLVG